MDVWITIVAGNISLVNVTLVLDMKTREILILKDKTFISSFYIDDYKLKWIKNTGKSKRYRVVEK